MTPRQLIKKIEKLPARAPYTEALEKLLLRTPHWYANQKEHWLGWLREYRSPGYGRTRFDRDAEFAYNHCGCLPMVLWLGEASGVDVGLVAKAAKSVQQVRGCFFAKCAATRGHIPWRVIVPLLLHPLPR